FPETADGSPDRKAIEAALPDMRTQFAVLDAAVRATGYLAGNSFTLADIDLLPTLFYMNKMPESRAMLAQSKHLKAYFDRHIERPSVKQTFPGRMPERFVHVLAQVAGAVTVEEQESMRYIFLIYSREQDRASMSAEE